ncbi:MAG: type II toxin-antitoxin system VapB family antitoxin [Symploca sp. SIO1A3]|nr:type II toxin-antitoxin system VapB family antitoxin [Symploca sp. SIO1A3]
MKTTIEIDDALLLRAKQLAAERQQTLKSIMEAALRQFLDANTKPQTPFKLRKHSFRGCGLQSHLTQSNWTMIREQIYEGQGDWSLD